MVAQSALRYTRSPDELVAALRAMVGVRRHPPMTVVADPLMAALVHGQDSEVPGIAAGPRAFRRLAADLA